MLKWHGPCKSAQSNSILGNEVEPLCVTAPLPNTLACCSCDYRFLFIISLSAVPSTALWLKKTTQNEILPTLTLFTLITLFASKYGTVYRLNCEIPPALLQLVFRKIFSRILWRILMVQLMYCDCVTRHFRSLALKMKLKCADLIVFVH